MSTERAVPFFGDQAKPESSGIAGEDNDLLPVRMLNEYAYCPRLFHLMHVQGRWADNGYTVEGRNVHRRVDQLDHVLPDSEASGQLTGGSGQLPVVSGQLDRSGEEGRVAAADDDASAGSRCHVDAGDEPPTITRSVVLGSEELGLTAKLDLVSTADGMAVPVETKRGRVPNNEKRSYEPERVQLMAQGLLLREHGYQCDHGVLYFAGSRTRVDVPFTGELEFRTLQLASQARLAARETVMPPPLDDSPKCWGCSLAGVCLPDETQALTEPQAGPDPMDIHRLFPARDDALPLYVQEQGAVVGKTGESLIVRKSGQLLGRASLKDVSQLVLCGNISVTPQTLHLLSQEGIPVVHLTMGHWFCGITTGITLRNAFTRSAQFAAAGEPAKCLSVAIAIVTAKGANQRTMLRRNVSPAPVAALADMAELLRRVDEVVSTEQLLGVR